MKYLNLLNLVSVFIIGIVIGANWRELVLNPWWSGAGLVVGIILAGSVFYVRSRSRNRVNKYAA